MKQPDSLYPIQEEYKVKRTAKRASYAKNNVNAIIDASYLCHISFIQNDKPSTIPMACWREGQYLYFHSANKGRLSKQLIGNDVCISIALFDGLVLGHSAFNHSYNFRSVVIHGRVEEVTEVAHKELSMQAFMEHVLPGRWSDLRPVKEKELRAISLMRVKLEQAVGKIRDEFPDEEVDTPDWPTWIGVIPVITQFVAPSPDPKRNKVTLPRYIAEYESIDKNLPQYPNK
jgi:nitroimidazol reductase NimA-like FMN-containing flavoprotein (pyridoxamine 5'-phosphate oxidase superfamily)